MATTAGSNTLPYLGSKISLISYAGIRYEGILFNINTTDSTVGLSSVRAYGTEGRKPGAEVPPNDEVYDYIVFRGKDIQDLTVSEPAHPDDPAIVAINPLPMPSVPQHDGPHGTHSMMSMMMGHRGMHGHGGMRGAGGMHGGPGGVHNGMHGGPGRGGYLGHRNMYGGGNQEYNRGYYGNPRYRGYGGRGARYNSRRVIGELTPQPNRSLKSQLEEAFDFDEANRKFEKNALAKGNTEDSAASALTTAEGKENAAAVTKQPVATVYDKKTSFFDHISCEALDRLGGHDARVDRNKQRQLDVETFGPAAAAPMRRMGRGYRRFF